MRRPFSISVQRAVCERPEMTVDSTDSSRQQRKRARIERALLRVFHQLSGAQLQVATSCTPLPKKERFVHAYHAIQINFHLNLLNDLHEPLTFSRTARGCVHKKGLFTYRITAPNRAWAAAFVAR